ncbi:MAG: hypothetical protein J0I20_01795 [Chloroflexi bacterium]|mgnify:CR=1 FL=1|nr:hypothetical protein [Chloroflexota bacterium]OJV89488.1 MAG: hypothetical protein BGO39_36590 [Chloroflexi bacterium 54-19]
MAEYETITLTLVGFPSTPGGEPREVAILAQTLKGSGLAYHLTADEPDEDAGGANGFDPEPDENVYIVTQVCSGKRLGKGGVATPRQAKIWLGLLCKICNWNDDLAAILAALPGRDRQAKLAALAQQIEQARLEAIEKTFFVVTGE